MNFSIGNVDDQLRAMNSLVPDLVLQNVNNETACSLKWLLLVQRPSQVHERKIGHVWMNRLEWFDRNICKIIMYFFDILKQSQCSQLLSAERFSASLVTLSGYFSGAFFAWAGGHHRHRSLWIAEGLPSKLTFTSLLGSSSVFPQEIMDNSTRLPCGVLLTSVD